MLQKRFVVVEFILVSLWGASRGRRALLLQRSRDDRVDERIDDLHRLLRLVAQQLPRGPTVSDPRALPHDELRLRERARKVLRRALLPVSVGARKRRGVRGVRQARAQRVHARAEEELGRAVEREAREQVLQVDRVARAQALRRDRNRVVRVPLEDVEVRDAVPGEEGARHRAVEPAEKLVYVASQNFVRTYFHISPSVVLSLE